MASQKYANLAQSSLSSGYTAGNTTLALQTGEGALFPSAGDFIVAIDDPVAFFLKCTSRTGDTLTVAAGGQEGTSTANKSAGTKVTQVITAGALDNIRKDISSLGVYASLPASGMKQGDQYQTTDSLYRFIFDGSNWIPFHMDRLVTLPPTSSWSWVNQGSATETQAGGYLLLNYPADATNSYRMRVRTLPANPVTIDATFYPLLSPNANFPSAGMCLRDAGGKLYLFGFQSNALTAAQLGITVSLYDSATSANAGDPLAALADTTVNFAPARFRIVVDAVHITFYYSNDGVTYTLFKQTGYTTFMGSGPTQVGYFVNARNASFEVNNLLLSWAGA